MGNWLRDEPGRFRGYGKIFGRVDFGTCGLLRDPSYRPPLERQPGDKRFGLRL
jgi:hypothetical protein